MLIIGGVDQLNIDAHAITLPSNAAFENGGNAEGFANLTGVGRLTAIRHDGCAGDYLEVADL